VPGGGHHARRLFGDGPAGQRTRPDQVRYAGHQPQVDGDRAACWQPCGRRRRSRKCRRQPRVVGGEDDQLTAACSFSSDPRSPPRARVAQLAGFGGAGETEAAENRGAGTWPGGTAGGARARRPAQPSPEVGRET